METWDTITARRNVREYADRPIAPDDLDRILEAGRRSPSSMNEQPWDFVVVTDRAGLASLGRRVALRRAHRGSGCRGGLAVAGLR